jgi:hypothetical protein
VGRARLANPWGAAEVRVTRTKDNQPVPVRKEGQMLLFPTQAGALYRVERA